jgi:iron complex transport system ATP-binding protein
MKDMLPLLTVRELVAYGRSPHAKGLKVRYTGQDQQIVDHVMKITGIQPYADRMFHTLSGGEQQKARIAMALAQQTGILLLDEPTTFLDIAHQFEVMDMLRRINHESGLTIVMIALKKGRIAVVGEPHEILTSAFLRDIYEMNATIKFEDGYPVIIPTIPHHSGGI